MKFNLLHLTAFIAILPISVKAQEQGFFLNQWTHEKISSPQYTDVKQTTDSVTTSITVLFKDTITKIPGYVFGDNATKWHGNMSNEPKLMKHLSGRRMGVLRGPGGSIGDVYFWNRSTYQRPSDVPDSLVGEKRWGFPVHYGVGPESWNPWQMPLDSLYRILNHTATTGMLIVNYGYARYGTSPDPVATAAHLAADWVRYDKGRTKFWEIGNEVFGHWEAGYQIDKSLNKDGQPEFINGKLYGQHCLVFIDSMRAAAAELDLDIKIGLVMIPETDSNFPRYAPWNKDVASIAGDKVDFYVVHSYYTPYLQNSDVETILNSYKFTGSYKSYVWSEVDKVGKPHLPIAITEYGIFAQGALQSVSHIYGMHNVLVTGEAIKKGYGAALRFCLADVWSLENVDFGMFSFGDEPGVQLYAPRPVFYHLYFQRRFTGDVLLNSTMRGDTNNVIVFPTGFSSGQAGITIVNKGRDIETVRLNIQNFKFGKRYYTYTLTGEPNKDFSRKVFVNGVGNSLVAGGPENYDSIKAFSSLINNEIKIKVPALSSTFILIEPGEKELVINEDINPSIINVTPDKTSIGKYQKIELTVNLTANYTNPYDYSQVNLKGIFIAPSGKKDTVDGFYYQDYTVYNNAPGNINTGINGSPEWKIRFTPTEIGNWQYMVYCIDKDGTSNTITQSFTCTSSASKGFIRKTNGNYLKYDDGSQYFPIGANYCWATNNPLGDYETWLESLSTNGGNFIRIWMASWSFGIEWSGEWNNTGLGNYAKRQENAFWLDWVIEYSRQKQISIELCLNNHGQVSSSINPEWKDNPYNTVNGGPCQNTWDFFTNATAKMYYKNKLRYIIARWGYSPNIFSWEKFNEVDLTDNYAAHAGEVSQWTNEMAIYMKNKDVNKHLVSTSYANSKNDSVTWKLPVIDYTQTHYYSSDPELESLINSGAKNYLNEYFKPTKNGEFGLATDPNELKVLDPTGIYIHNIAWNTAFSGSFGIGMSWWWDNYIHPQQIYKHYKVLSDFVSFIDLLSNKFISKNLVCQSDSCTTFSVFPVNNYWGKSASNDFTVTVHGELTPDINQLGKYLFGNDMRNPPTFHVNYKKNGVFKVKVANGGTSQTIEISLDGNPVLTQSAISNSTYSINVPAGEHSILVDNKGTSGIEISEYIFDNYVPVIKSTALVSSNKAFGWVHNRKYNWKNVNEKGIPDSVRNSKILVTGLDDGVYSTDWINCQTGNVISTTKGTSLNGEMKITCPDFLWDCAFKSTVILEGSTTVCKAQTVTYSIPPIANATSYIWTLPPGATGTNTTNSITVNYGTSAVSGSIKVKGRTNNGDTAESAFPVTVNSALGAAEPISGATSVYRGQNNVTYTVPLIPNAESYIWTLPTGATGTSTSNNIIVNYGTSASSGNISVKGHNNCGDGTGSTLAISVDPVPITYNPIQKILFDESHKERNSISDTQAKILNPEHPEWVSFSTLKAELTKNFIVENYPSGTITASLLKNYDILILSAPEDNFSFLEISSIVSFVNDGGGLCFLGDVGINEGINSILKNFGIQFINSAILKIVENGQDPGIPTFINFINHPSLGAKPQCLTSWGGSFNIIPPAIAVGFTHSLTWRDLDWNRIKDINEPLGPFTVMTASVYGKGRIFCTSDNSFNNDYANAYGKYNNELIINAMKWLTMPPITPALVSPLNAVSGVMTNTELQWASVESTNYYRIQVSKSSNFNSTVFDKLDYNTAVQLAALDTKSRYYWRVNTTNSHGESNWSEVWSFTTHAYNFIANTGNSATIKVPVSSANQLLQQGDEIGVFTSQGLCVGSGLWENTDLVITVWGDNGMTSAVDGIKNGEQFYFKIWRNTSGVEQNTDCLNYSSGDGKHIPNGSYIIASLFKPVTPIITQNGDNLHSDAKNGNQWFNKDGMIVGATAQDFSPKTSGDFHVVVSANGCVSNPSNSIKFIPTGIDQNDLTKTIKVYPNPTKNELTIEFEGNSAKTDFVIVNSIGQVVFTGILIEKTVVQTGSFAPGTYLIRLKSGDTFEFKKVLKM